MKILGISAFYHDSAAVLINDGRIVAAAHEERFTRKKHDPSFPHNAVKFCLDYGGVSINDLSAVVFYDKPLLKFERLLETYYAFAPKGLKQFLLSIPVWIKEKMFFKKLLFDEFKKIGLIDKKKITLLFTEHHLSHAASAFYPSPFKDSAILTIDGVGEWATASIACGKDKEITILKELRFPHSLGLLYSAFTYYTGFKVNSGEYKLMGLAPYGDPASERVSKFIKLIYDYLIDVKEDGSVWLNQEYFDYCTGLKMVNEDKWQRLFGFPSRKPEGDINQECCDMAFAIQKITEDVVLKMAKEAKKLTGSNNLCMAGGVALNCVANGLLMREAIFDNIWIQPAAGDAGGALGAALSAYHIYFDKPRIRAGEMDNMQGAYLGPEYTGLDIEVMAVKHKAVYERLDGDDVYEKVAGLLEAGNVIGWFQGRMEWGPRALGNRSIIADVRSPEMQKKLNLKIKYREGFRPFAPSVLAEDAGEYFENGFISPYMLLIDYVHNKRRNPLPDGYYSMPLKDKLYFLRSDIPSITHLDYTARVQTVHQETNPAYHKLISEFKKRTGYGVIVNTSFNVRGEPIVCAPEDAYKCFMRTEMDYLVMNNYIFAKDKQPVWSERRDWRDEYGLD
ncbi:MAG: carbamoyltransferase [Deltaproteobacteria bacterium]|nr:carbamoyltransferase [Deltaproteobacteria bacterium]